MISLFIHFLIGLLASFIGSLPFGVLNLTMVETVVKRGDKAGRNFAIGASIIEIIQAFIAIWFLDWFVHNPNIESYIKIASVPILVILGIVFIIRDPQCKLKAVEYKGSPILKSVYLSLLNPLVIPFWVFCAGYFHSTAWIEFGPDQLILFIVGIGFGKYFSLIAYGAVRKQIVKRLDFFNLCFNRMIAIVFILLGLIQLANLLLF